MAVDVGGTGKSCSAGLVNMNYPAVISRLPSRRLPPESMAMEAGLRGVNGWWEDGSLPVHLDDRTIAHVTEAPDTGY